MRRKMIIWYVDNEVCKLNNDKVLAKSVSAFIG